MFVFYFCLIFTLLFLLFKVHLWNTVPVFNIVCAGHKVLGPKLEIALYEAFKQLGPHFNLRIVLEGVFSLNEDETSPSCLWLVTEH